MLVLIAMVSGAVCAGSCVVWAVRVSPLDGHCWVGVCALLTNGQCVADQAAQPSRGARLFNLWNATELLGSFLPHSPTPCPGATSSGSEQLRNGWWQLHGQGQDTHQGGMLRL